MRAQDVMVKDIVKVDSCTLVDNAVKVMNKKDIGCLIIEDNGETRGIVTQRDTLRKVLEKAKDPRKLVVSDIMTKKLVVGSPDMEIHEAARLMFKKKMKKLPIVENGKLVGLITLTNIARTVGVDQKMIDMVDKLSNMRVQSSAGRLRKVRLWRTLDVRQNNLETSLSTFTVLLLVANSKNI